MTAIVLRRNCLYIYTDGSSLPKPRRGGIGIRYIYLDEVDEEYRIDHEEFGYKSATNNQMELLAVIEGIENCPGKEIPVHYNRIEIRTDSKYVADNYSKAMFQWSRTKWLNYAGKPIENAELWKRFNKAVKNAGVKVEVVWVKGHSKDPDNKAVDKAAKQSAKSVLHPELTNIKLRRKKSKQLTKSGSVPMLGQRVSVHIINEEYLRVQKLSKYRYEVISEGSRYFGCVDIAYSELHHLKAGHKYLVTFNKNINNPRILKCIREIE